MSVATAHIASGARTRPMTDLVRIEYAKLRGLRIGVLGLLMTCGTVLFACANLFSSAGRARMTDLAHPFWEPHLIGYVMATALFTPVAVTVLASRVVDVEHAGNGWGMFALAGVGRGRQCRVKWLALVPLVVALRALEMAAVIGVPLLLGARPLVDPGAWLLLGVQACGTALALLALHLWLATRVESQLVGVGLGITGGLIGVLSLLAPQWMSCFTPWGYFSVLLPYTFTTTGVSAVAPLHVPWLVFCVAVAALVTVLTRRLDEEKN